MTSRSEKGGSPGAREALRAHLLPKGPPPADYVPPVSTFPGRKPTLLAGQLDLYGGEYVKAPRRKQQRRGRN